MTTAKIIGQEHVLATLKQIAEKKGRGAVAKAGILEGSKNQQGVSIPMYAAMNEFGGRIPVTPKMRRYLSAAKGIHLGKNKRFINIPSRPFMRMTVDRCYHTWVDDLGRLLKAGRGPLEALDIMGSRMAEDIRATIKTGRFAPNVIKKPSGNPPLYDSGDMLHSIDHEVVS